MIICPRALQGLGILTAVISTSKYPNLPEKEIMVLITGSLSDTDVPSIAVSA